MSGEGDPSISAVQCSPLGGTGAKRLRGLRGRLGLSGKAPSTASRFPSPNGGGIGASLLALLATLTLAACYGSPALLLDPDQAAHPLEDGVYERADAGDDRFRVSAASDGWYSVEKIESGGLIGQTHRVLLNKITLDGGREGFAVAEQANEGYEYAVAVIDHGRIYLATPDCVDPLDREDAVDHGGQAEEDDPMTHICSFKTRGALVAALAAYAGHATLGAPYLRK